LSQFVFFLLDEFQCLHQMLKTLPFVGNTLASEKQQPFTHRQTE
jgi:hypothetical protein